MFFIILNIHINLFLSFLIRIVLNNHDISLLVLILSVYIMILESVAQGIIIRNELIILDIV